MVTVEDLRSSEKLWHVAPLATRIPDLAFASRSAVGVWLCLAVVLSGNLAAASEIEPGETSVRPLRAEVPSYRVEILGVPERALRVLLEETSQLIALRDRPPATFAGLRRRITADLATFETALRSEGYYRSTLAYDIDRESEPITVAIHVSPGPVYRLAQYEIRYVGAGAESPGLPTDIESLGLHIGMAGQARFIVQAERVLLQQLPERAHPLARIVDRTVVVDHADTSISVTVEVEAGPAASFGAVTITGLTSVDEDYVRAFLEWSEGEPYDQRQVDTARLELLGTGLFTSVIIEHTDPVIENGALPITVTVDERKHRSIGAGVSFSTDIGFGGEVFWEHRNLFQQQERLHVSANIAQINQQGGAIFRKPHFLRRQQDLVASAGIKHQDTDAFEELSLSAFGGLERRLDDRWHVSAGVPIEYSVLDDDQGERTFTLFGLSLGAVRDSSDSRLDPTRGTRLQLSLTPYYGFSDENLRFLVSDVSGTAYLSVTKDRRIILAGRSKIGSIVGESTEALPANKRFFAGGGGSIRGYEFQRVGPLDQNNNPLGGRSLVEVGAEVRLKLTESFGIVAFAEGGNVYRDVVPDFSRELQWAAGLGLRYFTRVGPLRFDIGFPLNPRKNIDDAFQFYISFGQAF